MKCNKCDARGYIADPNIPGASHSCECGWAMEQMEKAFAEVSLGELLSYGAKRAEEKGRQT